MYYDDEARRFNFVSGFLLGAVLGTGIALVVGAPAARGKKRGKVGSTAESAIALLKKESGRSVSKLRKRVRRL